MTAVTPIHRSVLARPRPYSFLQLIKVHNQDSTLNTPFSDDLTSAIIAVFELLKCSSRGISDSPKLVTSMRFRSELLQRRPSDDSEATLPKFTTCIELMMVGLKAKVTILATFSTSRAVLYKVAIEII